MSTGTVSPQFDQFSDSSTIVGVDKTREEYLKLFSRASYSPLYDRPYSSPVSGLYDAINSPTKLVLLNYRFKNSHLREQVLPEELSSSSKRDFDYESFIVQDRPKPKAKPKPIPFQSILIDILKGQTKFWHDRRCTSSCLADSISPQQSQTLQVNQTRSTSVNRRRLRRSQSVLAKKDNYYNEPQSFLESFCQYHRDMNNQSVVEQLDLQQDPIKEQTQSQMKISTNNNNNTRRKLPLTKGQQLYLIGKHHIYDNTETKLRRSNSYGQTLNNRYQADHHCKPQFRLSDTQDYSKYSKYFHPPRSLSPITFPKAKQSIDSQKSFTLNSNQTSIAKRLLSISIPT